MKPTTTDLYRELSDQVSVSSITHWLKEMIAIPSVNPMEGDARPGHREQEIGEYYLEQMHELGLTVASREAAPGRPNVFGTRAGSQDRPSLMLCGHLDTVPTEGYDDPYTPHEKNGRIYGRGSCDMKAALACYLEVARLLRDADVTLSGSLILCGVADEEWQMIGSREIGRNGPFADQCIIGEPSDLSVCPAHKGQFGLFIRPLARQCTRVFRNRGKMPSSVWPAWLMRFPITTRNSHLESRIRFVGMALTVPA